MNLINAMLGRFGNQAEQFLGTIQFAKHLNRTLVLPPFIEYVKYQVCLSPINNSLYSLLTLKLFFYQINFVPFREYIDVDRLREYHRVVEMDTFMSELAPLVWKECELLLCSVVLLSI